MCQYQTQKYTPCETHCENWTVVRGCGIRTVENPCGKATWRTIQAPESNIDGCNCPECKARRGVIAWHHDHPKHSFLVKLIRGSQITGDSAHNLEGPGFPIFQDTTALEVESLRPQPSSSHGSHKKAKSESSVAIPARPNPKGIV